MAAAASKEKRRARRKNVLGIVEGIFIALEAIWANKLRAFLTVLGNIIAVTSIILVVSIIQGLDAEVTDIFASQGTDVFSVVRSGVAVFRARRAAGPRQPAHRPRRRRHAA